MLLDVLAKLRIKIATADRENTDAIRCSIAVSSIEPHDDPGISSEMYDEFRAQLGLTPGHDDEAPLNVAHGVWRPYSIGGHRRGASPRRLTTSLVDVRIDGPETASHTHPL